MTELYTHLGNTLVDSFASDGGSMAIRAYILHGQERGLHSEHCPGLLAYCFVVIFNRGSYNIFLCKNLSTSQLKIKQKYICQYIRTCSARVLLNWSTIVVLRWKWTQTKVSVQRHVKSILHRIKCLQSRICMDHACAFRPLCWLWTEDCIFHYQKLCFYKTDSDWLDLKTLLQVLVWTGKSFWKRVLGQGQGLCVAKV